MNALLIDDHVMFRVGVRLLLGTIQPTIHVLEAGSLAQACSLLGSPHSQVDVALLDLKLPDAVGMVGFDAIRAIQPDLPICILSAEEDPTLIRNLIEAGAFSFIHKSAPPSELSNALDTLIKGGAYLPSTAISSVTSKEKHLTITPHITPRQREVLILMIRGHSTKVIAKRLGISDTTVKSHIDALFNAFGVSNRTEAVYAVAKLGWY